MDELIEAYFKPVIQVGNFRHSCDICGGCGDGMHFMPCSPDSQSDVHAQLSALPIEFFDMFARRYVPDPAFVMLDRAIINEMKRRNAFHGTVTTRAFIAALKADPGGGG